MSDRVFNFAAGPATLPLEVIETIKSDLPVFGDTGASIIEISHRSAAFEAVADEAEANLRALMGLPESYHVLFLQGGASTQFAMVPLNLLGPGQVANYALTGVWGKKAVAEARRAGEVHVAFSDADAGFRRVPRADELDLSDNAAYLHLTSNETVHGVQFAELPDVGTPLVVDGSSDFLSRPIDIERYGMLYAGAQKNVGPAGVTIVVMSDEMLRRTPEDQYSMLSYRVHAAKRSMFNTPPCFAIYVVALVTRWLRDRIGGLDAMAALNQTKAERVYAAIDGSGGFYRGHAERESRSLMNVTMRLENDAMDARFVQAARDAGLAGLKGHRITGGLRASIYNAMPLEGVDALVQFMAEFQRTEG